MCVLTCRPYSCLVVYPYNTQFILLTHLLRKHCIVEAYSNIIEDRETADRQQKEVEHPDITTSLESATDVTKSSMERKQKATKVVSSFVEQTRRPEYTQSHTAMDTKLQQLCEIFPDVPLERVKAFLVASGYNTQIAATALSNKSTAGAASPSLSPVGGHPCAACGLIHPPVHGMNQRRTTPQLSPAANTQPTYPYDRSPVSPSGTAQAIDSKLLIVLVCLHVFSTWLACVHLSVPRKYSSAVLYCVFRL